MSTAPLLEALLRAAPESLGDALRSLPDVEGRLAAMLSSARSTWPQLQLDEAAFAAHVGARLRDDDDVALVLDMVAAADLFLACACASGDEAAVEIFVRDYLDGIRAVAGRIQPQGVDEVAQRVLTLLLTGSHPAIADFAGRGSLRSWLRVFVTRRAHDFGRGVRRHRAESLDDIAEAAAEDESPELLSLKTRYRAEFRRAFASAFETLTVRERNLLRHDYLDKLTTEAICNIYGVHRASVARWRADARAKLLRETRRHFEQHAQLSERDFDSIMFLIESQMEVSLTRLLHNRPPDPSTDGT